MKKFKQQRIGVWTLGFACSIASLTGCASFGLQLPSSLLSEAKIPIDVDTNQRPVARMQGLYSDAASSPESVTPTSNIRNGEIRSEPLTDFENGAPGHLMAPTDLPDYRQHEYNLPVQSPFADGSINAPGTSY